MLRLVDNDWYYNLAIRVRTEDRDKVFDFLETEWKRLIPNVPFRGIYQEETLEEARYINASIKKIFVFLALVATLLSLIGLYNLISLNIINRTKEIGIRKVLGAGIPSIAIRTNRSFIIIIVLSSVLGCVGGYLLTDTLMDSIWANHLDFELFSYIISFLGMIIVSAISVSGRVYKAAITNPAVSLRYE